MTHPHTMDDKLAPESEGWQPVRSAPTNIEVEARHALCPGYDTNGLWDGREWQLDAYFISGKTRLMYINPTHWRHLQGVDRG